MRRRPPRSTRTDTLFPYTTRFRSTLVRRDPIGVVGAIVPWNYPVILSMSKIATSLAPGCAVVLKPSPGPVLDCYLVAEAAAEAGIPAGVPNWVPGGRQLGASLFAHPAGEKFACTGSTEAGRSEEHPH